MKFLLNYKLFEAKANIPSDKEIEDAENFLKKDIFDDWDYTNMGNYFIDVSGKYQVYYTFWRFKPSKSPYVNPVRFITNLSIDFDKAIKKAKNIAGKVPVELDRTGTLDALKNPKKEFLTFGKYRGKHIGDIYAEDPKYIVWMADNYHGHQETADLLNYYKGLYFENVTKENKEKDKSTKVGNIGEEIKITVKVYNISSKTVYNNFSHDNELLTTYKLIDDNENKYIAYNIEKHFQDIKVNDSIELKGKIKGYKEILGINFNILNYVRVIKE
jgi:hypothetical protein